MTERMKELGIDRPTLDEQETRDLIGFLYTLNYFEPPGNPAAGKRLFTEKRCIVCHQFGGAGGVVGPNLDHLVQFRSPLSVAAAMWNHGPQMAAAMKEKGIERPVLTAPELRDLIAFLSPETAEHEEGPLYVLPGRSENGRQLFSEKRCIECHSVGRIGGKVGPDLVDLGIRRSPVEFAVAIWNKAPAMMAAMRQRGITVPQLTPENMADLVAYLYAVRYFASGNISNGWKVALDKGCLSCHSVRGERGKPASDLTKARGLDSPAGVIAALWNHAVVAPPATPGKKQEWPLFQGAEMADLVALLQTLPRK
jgi:cytochrome c2